MAISFTEKEINSSAVVIIKLSELREHLRAEIFNLDKLVPQSSISNEVYVIERINIIDQATNDLIQVVYKISVIYDFIYRDHFVERTSTFERTVLPSIFPESIIQVIYENFDDQPDSEKELWEKRTTNKIVSE